MRAFSKKQRDALLFSSGGICQLCKQPLGVDWHADHIIPFSKGGPTDVTNGQALCAACNLSKGNRMLRPRPKRKANKKDTFRAWQVKAIDQILQRSEGGKRSTLIQACPGAGKTLMACGAVNEMEGVKKIIVISPSKNVQKNWQNVFSKKGHELKTDMLNPYSPDFKDYCGMSLTFQFVNGRHHDLRMYVDSETVVIADEIHHSPEGQPWGNSFKNAFSEAKHIILLTATPQNANGSPLPFIKYDNDGFPIAAEKYGLEQAIRDKICRAPVFQFVDIREFDFKNGKDGNLYKFQSFEEAQDVSSSLENQCYQAALSDHDVFRKSFKIAHDKLMELRRSRGYKPGGLIVARDIATAHLYEGTIKEVTGKEPTIVHSKQKNSDKKINDFNESNSEWIIAVEMIAEGVDIPRLQVLLFMHDAKTDLWFTQVVGRIMRTIDQSYHDLHAYVFCLKHHKLKELAEKIEDEVKEAEQIKDNCTICDQNPCVCPCDVCGHKPCICVCQVCEKKPCICPCPMCGEKPCVCPPLLPDELLNADIEMDELIHAGKIYSIEVRLEAVRWMKSGALEHARVPFVHVCAMVVEMNLVSDPKPSSSDEENQPIEDIKKNIKNIIASIARNIIAMTTHGKPTNSDYSLYHYNLNKSMGIKKVDEASLAQLHEMLRRVNDEYSDLKKQQYSNEV